MTLHTYGLTEKSGNSSKSGAEFENWNMLSAEIKEKCIETLDFKNKWFLRSTSFTERALVDKQKLTIKRVKLDSSSSNWMLVYPDNSFSSVILFKTFTESEKLIPILNYISERGSIDTFEITEGKIRDANLYCRGVIERITNLFSVKKLIFNDMNDENIDFWLGRMDENLETVEFIGSHSFDLLSIPRLSNVSVLRTEKMRSLDFIHHLAQAWIDNNADVGRVFGTIILRKSALSEFSEHFSERIISSTSKRVRIRTDNSENHILLESETSSPIYMGKFQEYLEMSVIVAKEQDFHEYFPNTSSDSSAADSDIDNNENVDSDSEYDYQW